VEQNLGWGFVMQQKRAHPMPSAKWYRRKADECVALAKAATMNEEKARHWAVAEHYVRLATDEIKAAQPSKHIPAVAARRSAMQHG
jgi:hypothetical protein